MNFLPEKASTMHILELKKNNTAASKQKQKPFVLLTSTNKYVNWFALATANTN